MAGVAEIIKLDEDVSRKLGGTDGVGKFLNQLKDAVVTSLRQEATSWTFPEYEACERLGGVGDKVDYKLRGTRIVDISSPVMETTLSPLGLMIQNLFIKVHGDWKYDLRSKIRFLGVKDSGGFDLKQENCRISVVVALSMVENRAHLQVLSCQEDVGSADIELRGGASAIYNNTGLRYAMKNRAGEGIWKKINEKLVDLISSKGNEILSSMKETPAILPDPDELCSADVDQDKDVMNRNVARKISVNLDAVLGEGCEGTIVYRCDGPVSC